MSNEGTGPMFQELNKDQTYVTKRNCTAVYLQQLDIHNRGFLRLRALLDIKTAMCPGQVSPLQMRLSGDSTKVTSQT